MTLKKKSQLNFSKYQFGVMFIVLIVFFMEPFTLRTLNWQGQACSTWIADDTIDFNGSGARFVDCELNVSDSGVTVSLSKGPDWIEKPRDPSPSSRSGCQMATLGNSTRALLHGGNDGFNNLADTWTYDFGKDIWNEETPASHPTSREDFMLSGIQVDEKAILFGGKFFDGTSNLTYLDDTWIYSLASNDWKKHDMMISPPARSHGALASVFNTDKVILFGGRNSTREFDDTWIFDLNDNEWTRVWPLACPSPRSGHAMATIATDDKIMLFGGRIKDGTEYCDTWIFDLSDCQWHQVFPSNVPKHRCDHAMATIYGGDKVLLFGGQSRSDAWIFDMDEASWNLLPSRELPQGRHGAGIGSVHSMEKVVLFGGLGLWWYSDTWSYLPSLYRKTGYYESPIHDIGSESHFTYISCEATIPRNTRMWIQLRTTIPYLFLGPDGTPNTSYAPNSPIWPGHLGGSWIQYRVFFQSDFNKTLSPSLNMVTVDFTRFPEIPILTSPSSSEWINHGNPKFEWIFNDTDDSEQGGFEWELYSMTNVTFPSRSSGIVNSSIQSYIPGENIKDGRWTWRVRTRDRDGTWGPFSSDREVSVDATPPLPFVPTASPANWTNGPCTITFSTFDETSGLRSVEFWLDGILLGMPTSPVTLSNLTDGAHQAVVKARDNAGNLREGSTRILQDGTPPEVFVPTLLPPRWTNGSARLSFSTTDARSGIDHYEVRVDSGDFTRASSPLDLENLTEGDHLVVVRAVDRAGNSRDTTVRIGVDRNEPRGLLIAISPAEWTNQDPVLSFAATDDESGVDHYELKVNDGYFTRVVGPITLTGLREGRNALTVRACDGAGNFVEGLSEAFIDRTPPAAFQPAARPGGWTNLNPNVEFATTDDLSGIDNYEIRIDGRTFRKADSPYQFISLDDGQHLVTVRAHDRAGNCRDGWTNVSIDTHPPEILMVTIEGSGKTEGVRNVTFQILARDNASGVDQMCFSNDGGKYSPWEPFSRSKEWNLTPGEGKKAVHIRVRDKAGNEPAPTVVRIASDAPRRSEAPFPLVFPISLVLLLAVGVVSCILLRRTARH